MEQKKPVRSLILAALFLIAYHGAYTTGMINRNMIILYIAVVIYATLSAGMLAGIFSSMLGSIYIYFFYFLFPVKTSSVWSGSPSFVNKFVKVLPLFITLVLIIFILKKAELNKNMKTALILQHNELQLREITDNMRDIICKVNISGAFEYVSPSVEQILGCTPDGLMGKDCFERIHPADLSHALNCFHNIQNDKLQKSIEFRYKHKNGHYIWLESSASLIKDSSNEAIAVVICSRDITRRKQTEDALRESEDKYRNLIEFIPDAIIVHRDGNILFANAAAAKLFKTPFKEDLIHRSIFSMIHTECCDTAIPWVFRSENNLVSMPVIEGKLLALNGDEIDIEISSVTLPYRGSLACLVICRDITERKKAQHLEQEFEERTKQLNHALEMDKLRTEFFANLSHELRTPLNVILSTLQMQEFYINENQMNADPLKLIRYSSIMKQDCYRLLRLINNLIDITRIDCDFLRLNLQLCNIISIIEEISLSVADYIENKDISLQFDTEIEERIIPCDPDILERIILNVLSNAVKFTNPGGRIDISVSNMADHILLSVKDTGIGIPADKLELIFERFGQVNKSLTRDHEGSGIGLSIAKSLMEMHGGKISAKSEYGKGTEIIIEIPCNLHSAENVLVETACCRDSIIQKINIEFSDIYAVRNLQ